MNIEYLSDDQRSKDEAAGVWALRHAMVRKNDISADMNLFIYICNYYAKILIIFKLARISYICAYETYNTHFNYSIYGGTFGSPGGAWKPRDKAGK